MKLQLHIFLYLVSILILSSCGSSNNVVSKRLIQKHKYTKGWHFNNRDFSTKKPSQTNSDRCISKSDYLSDLKQIEVVHDQTIINHPVCIESVNVDVDSNPSDEEFNELTTNQQSNPISSNVQESITPVDENNTDQTIATNDQEQAIGSNEFVKNSNDGIRGGYILAILGVLALSVGIVILFTATSVSFLLGFFITLIGFVLLISSIISVLLDSSHSKAPSLFISIPALITGTILTLIFTFG